MKNFSLEEKRKSDITNVLLYYVIFSQIDDAFTSSPTIYISCTYIATAGEFHSSILEILDHWQIIPTTLK